MLKRILVIIIALHFMTQRPGDTKKIGAEVFGDPWNVMLEENWDDKMIRECK